MKNYQIQEISKNTFLHASISTKLNYNVDNERVRFYAITGDTLHFFFSNSGAIDYDFAPYFVETHNILFVIFYEKIYALSLKTGQIKLAMELEHALVGAEKYDDELIVITDASMIRIRIDEITDICFITDVVGMLCVGGFITDYKILENGILHLTHEDGSVTDYQLSPTSQIS